ncbi:acyltransferase family protein [Phycisphaeraceae bacterium D3-23]
MTQTHPSPTPAKAPRFHGFDALRGGAMLLGIVLHAAITYMVRPMDGLLWPLEDQPTSYGFDVVFWWIHGWRIPLFFVMAGFFAAMLARRRGADGFIKHRVLRILIPVTAATLTILPAMYYLWGWGWRVEGRATWNEVARVSFEDAAIDTGYLGPAHLWFLNYLVVFAFAYWGILKWRSPRIASVGGPDEERKTAPTDSSRGLHSEIAPGPGVRALYNSGLRPFVFALPTFAALYFFPGMYLDYHHILPRTGGQWVFEVVQIAYQGYFFAVGVYLFRLHRDMAALTKWTGAYLVGSLAAFGVAMVYARRYFEHVDSGGAFGALDRLGLAVGVSLFCWLMVWGMVGLGLTVLARPRAWVRWLSDSAYWVYLVHLPLVGLGVMLLRDWPVSPWVKFSLIVAAAGVATLVSYRYLVRFTWLGRALNGPRGGGARPSGARSRGS